MLFATLACCALAAQIPKPATYASTSGRRELTVEPRTRGEALSATYRMRLDGVELWRAELSFALENAVVAEDGRVAGYALVLHPGTKGVDLGVILISAEGRVLAQDLRPWPECFELRLVAGAQRVLYRVERSEQTWRVTEISRIAFPPPDLSSTQRKNTR